MFVKITILIFLMAIVASMGSSLYFLAKDGQESKRMVKALTLRVALSVAGFILLFIAWYSGLIQPHDALPQ